MPKRKRRRKSNYAKVMPIIYIKGSFMKHPCMVTCKATNRKVILCLLV
jgi:hypothetical protein